MKTAFTSVMLIVATSGFSQTWLEKGLNGLNYGSSNPPTTVTVNDYSEPFDTTWRLGYTGIGTASWPLTRLHVHSNNNVDSELSSLLTGFGLNATDFTSILTSGGTTSSPLTSSLLGFVHRSNQPNLLNYALTGIVSGDGMGENKGLFALAIGDNNGELMGAQGIGEGNQNDRSIGLFGIGSGDGQVSGNFGVWGQCNTVSDQNSVNVGVFGRGVLNTEPALVNIGVHGVAECGTGGGTQFNCAIYGQRLTCSDSVFTTGPYPVGSFAGYFDGDVYVDGNLWQTSDRRLKENIRPLVNVLESLRKLNTYTYNFKKGTGFSLPSGKEYGLISQEVAQVFPELTQDLTVINGRDPKTYRNLETVKAIEYTAFIPLLIQATKELDEKIQALDPNKVLEAMTALKQRIEELETQLDSKPSLRTGDARRLKAYPNPSDGDMVIEISCPDCNQCVLLITDLSGRYVKEVPVRDVSEKIHLHASDFPAGAYICNLLDDGQIAAYIRIAFAGH
jgi:hypothetical protein